MGRPLIRILAAIVLSLVLSACTVVPSTDLVQRAIAQELSQVQPEISRHLRLGPDSSQLEISGIKVLQRTPLKIGNLRAFRVQGVYDLTMKLPERSIVQRQNPFEIYLQRQQEGKTWRRARLTTGENGEPIWETQFLPALP